MFHDLQPGNYAYWKRYYLKDYPQPRWTLIRCSKPAHAQQNCRELALDEYFPLRKGDCTELANREHC